MTWPDDVPEGKLDLLMSIDFRMTSTTLLSDVVLPAATWYEKADLSSTDMHPFVHAFSPAIDPPWKPGRITGVRRHRPRVQHAGHQTPGHPHRCHYSVPSSTTPWRHGVPLGYST